GGRRRNRHGIGNRRGQRERRCHPDWKRPVQTSRNLTGCAPLSWHYHAEFRRYVGSGQYRSWDGSLWLSESAIGRLYSRGFGIDVHPEFNEVVAPELRTEAMRRWILQRSWA